MQMKVYAISKDYPKNLTNRFSNEKKNWWGSKLRIQASQLGTFKIVKKIGRKEPYRWKRKQFQDENQSPKKLKDQNYKS